MIKSMTGFGKATISLKGKSISVEIRSLNSKQLDMSLRMPGIFRDKENDLRGIILKELERGKIDLSVYIENEKNIGTTFINRKLAKAYFAELKSLARDLKTPQDGLLEMVLGMPEVVKPERSEFEPYEWPEIKAAIEKAVKEINRFRRDEGKSLQKELEKRVQFIHRNLRDISTLDENRILAMRKKIRAAISDLKTQVDENRFEQELIFYLEKLDITEEKVRLKTHCEYFLKTMKEESSGRKLNFISQEMGREINTIGSKANDAGMQKLVVEMKDELEKIKEQLNNVL